MKNCPAKDCEESIVEPNILCNMHWGEVPKQLRRQVQGLIREHPGSPEHEKAVAAAIAIARRAPARGPANVKSWASILDEGTRLQAEKLSRAPGIAGHVALMPDAHLGIGATVGSVIPTFEDTIIPAAVGVDIGCGMMAVQTNLTQGDLPGDMQPLVHQLGRSIPAGVGQNRDVAGGKAEAWFAANPIPDESIFEGGRKRRQPMLLTAKQQLGTLGSGNHFVEVCLDEADAVWIVLHSGSRGIGNNIAQIFIERAKAENTEDLEDSDLARLTGESFDAYVPMMEWAQRYAYTNREFMMDATIDDLQRFAGNFEIIDRINCHHNFAAIEEHFGKRVWLTRKGAIKADVGDRGIIPGSMGAATYIVDGLGNPDSYNSSAHGAGRMFSRTRARKEFTTESLSSMMEGKAWNFDNARKLLDEHPDAYKPIAQVMEDQKDLVRPTNILRQIVNYKGS